MVSCFVWLLQVETIGDAYMVAAGLLDTAKEHALAICSMAFDMMEEASKVMEPNNQTTLQVSDYKRLIAIPYSAICSDCP